jgi:hypothetical protein
MVLALLQIITYYSNLRYSVHSFVLQHHFDEQDQTFHTFPTLGP